MVHTVMIRQACFRNVEPTFLAAQTLKLFRICLR